MVKHLHNYPKTASRHGNLATICGWLGIIIFGCMLVISCGGSDPGDIIDDFFQDPDSEPIRATIKTAVPLAHIAAVSMEAVHGNPSTEVTYCSTTCSSYPCLALVSMELDPQNLPFAYDTNGGVTAAGLWTSRYSAILTVTFHDVHAGVPTFPVSQISTFPVIQSSGPGGEFTIVYADIDINIVTVPDDLSEQEIQDEFDRLDVVPSDNAEVNLSLDAWVVKLSPVDTPNDYTDDRYSISGGGQYIGVISNRTSSSTNVMQLGLANVLISHDCSTNPTEGHALINEVAIGRGSMPVVATALMAFDSSCDGKIQVVLGTGNYAASTGRSIPMNLNLP